MCVIFPEELAKIFSAIRDFKVNNNIFKMDDLEGSLKDYLADLKEEKKISHCGCENIFKVTTNEAEDRLTVSMQIYSLYEINIVGNDISHRVFFHSEIEGYDDMVENEYLEI